MKNLKDNTLLIIPNHLKETILLSFCDELKNIKIMTESEFLKKYYFDYDLETIYYLMNKYKLKYEVVLIYLKNLYYVENKEYSNEKLNKLVEIKKELEEHNLLKYKPLFLNKLKSMNIVFYNFYDLDKFYLNLIDNLKKITSIEVINEGNNCYYEHKIYEFKNAEEEVEFVATKICELVLSGVNINNIVLLNSSDIYTNHIKRIFKYFSIPINIKDNNSLLGTKMGTFFLENINSDISKTFELLEINFDLKNSLNLEIYNRLITISNKFSFVSDYMKIKELLKVELLNTKLSDVILDEAVKVEVLEDYIPNDNEYVFLLGFNQGECPKNLKDEDYINDLLKEKLNLSTTTSKNIIHSKKIINIIKNVKNLWITYKLNGEQGSLTVSSLNEKLNYEVIHNIKISYNYSNLNNNLKLARYMDDYLKYGSKNEDLDLLNNTYKNNVYRKYDNKFNGIKKTSENITLSYSSMDNYYKCSFKYYISSILKLNCYEETFMTYIGSLFHYVLSKKDNLSLEDSIIEFMNNNPKEFTNKENFFLEKLKKDLEFILDVIKKQKDYTNFHNALYEKYIEIPKGNDKFIGIVDKILLNDNKTLGAIVDYKTGNPSLELNYIEYGLGLQFIYILLIK